MVASDLCPPLVHEITFDYPQSNESPYEPSAVPYRIDSSGEDGDRLIFDPGLEWSDSTYYAKLSTYYSQPVETPSGMIETIEERLL